MIRWVLVAILALSDDAAKVAPPDPAQLMSVRAELQAWVQAHVVAGGGEQERLQRLLHFLSEPEPGLAMVCRADATQSVAPAYLNRQANCVNYTMLFLVLAKQARLDAYPQETEEILEWQQ